MMKQPYLKKCFYKPFTFVIFIVYAIIKHCFITQIYT